MSNTNLEMNTYKKIPVIIKKDKDGSIIRTIYPQYYQQQKEAHLENYRSVLNKIFYKALMKRFSDPFERAVIEHIYDEHHTTYKFDINDISIEKITDTLYEYDVFIENDKWSVNYQVELLREGQSQRERLDEYLEEHLCYFIPHSIWIHLDGKVFDGEEKEQSTYEDTDTKCPICLEDYDEDKEPHPLHNCGHNYCGNCVDQVIEYGTCGICRMTTNTETEPTPIVKEDIEGLCEAEDSETLIKWLKEFNVYNQFKRYILDADGLTHILGYETGTDVDICWTEEQGANFQLMSRLEQYEKKMPINPYNM